jgi:glycosyltransferase involved in cell wall biosynthesis|tara:strand:- start:8216 stop:9388 length:1173 start_codon:yes stop_codon:yes gene_type:complete
MGKKTKQKGKTVLPFVSVCTPTFNRRPFWEMCIQNFKNQDYPMDRMEWIIIDDGTDLIEDLVKDIPQVKYFKYDTKMTLGKKRNLMHDKSCGDIIVYMDDDDYYPKERVSHAVNMLVTHPNAMCAGASEIYIWFKHIQKMWQFGPYNPNHATAGTFAFKRELLKQHRYEDHAALAEEKAFLKNYTVPFVQLEPKKTILVFSHIQNTFDKKKLLENGQNQYQKVSPRTVDEFIQEPAIKEFYMNTIDKLLNSYEPGDPKNKPDVLKQIKEIEAERRKMVEDHKQKQQTEGKIILNQNGENIELNNQQIVQIMQKQQEQLQKMSKMIDERDSKMKRMEIEIKNFKQQQPDSAIVDITDKDNSDFKMNFLNVDLKLDILTRICETIRTEQTKK